MREKCGCLPLSLALSDQVFLAPTGAKEVTLAVGLWFPQQSLSSLLEISQDSLKSCSALTQIYFSSIIAISSLILLIILRAFFIKLSELKIKDFVLFCVPY